MPRDKQNGGRPERLANAAIASDAARPGPRVSRLPSGRSAVRIIGGEWRGRKLHFPQSADLRPTPDRVRETLFNWLQFHVHGRRCLDLFTGSGALGFEALSRGAGAAVFVEKDAAAAAQIAATFEAF